ncbi:hypothetical protein SAY86_029821 [Trapa natans]|uniref:Dof zinc finger protein n=1 Tax=Trapa natans TaxID=22666 RepID=A0AAN7RD96_TRANT|nr:hypothetical protein SAY86_029821 [Trapa natans]
MAFSSIPTYNLDQSNWQQVPNDQLVNASLSNIISSSSRQLPPAMAPVELQPHGQGNPIRPNSLVERARMANIPMPESALKCPRCESTNTKFCYFNNYTLTQPRHFCKTCRRYWTQGGALRNVPVGGGCRRNNKKSGNKSNNSTSKVADAAIVPPSGGNGIGSSSADGFPGISSRQMNPHLRFVAQNAVHHLGDHFGQVREFGGLNNYEGNASMFHSADHLSSNSDIFGDISGPHSISFYPSRGGFVDSFGLYNGANRVVTENMLSASGLLRQASMKLEHNQELSLSRQFQQMAGNYEHHCFSGAGSAWTSGSASLCSSSMNTNDTR